MLNYKDALKQYGTPSYIYDIDILKERVKYLQNKLGKNYDLVYAVKANTFIPKYIEDMVSRYEICSPGEFQICNALNIKHQKMVISGVYKDYATIDLLIKNYPDILKYTIESMEQYRMLNDLTQKYQRTIHLLLRLTSGNQFGISESEVIEIIQNNQNPLITIDGIEYFSGTQKHSLKRVEKEINYLREFVQRIEEELNFSINEIEYGPGLPIFYFQDEEFNEDEFLDNVKNILDTLDKKVTLEIGRSIASSCGCYLTKVVDLKENKNGHFAILDGGINHLVYYGQTMAMKIPYYEVISNSEEKNETLTYNLCGSLCTINDILVKNLTLTKLNIGDVFIFKNVGAYSVTEGISLFLSRDLPKVIIKNNNTYQLVRDNIATYKLNFPKAVRSDNNGKIN